MDTDNLMLVAGTYADAGAAAEDFKTLKAGQDAGEYQVVGAVVMNRDASGKVEVQEHGDGRAAGGAVLGGTAGLVVGLFAPPLLAATAIGAGIGAGIGALNKRHAEKKLGVEVEEYLPPGSSAVVAVVDDVYADKVEAALVKSDKRINQAIDSGDYDELQKAISKSADRGVGRGHLVARDRRGRRARRPLLTPRRGETDETHPHTQPHRRRSVVGVPRGRLRLERRRLDARRPRVPPPPRPGRAASARRSRPGRPRSRRPPAPRRAIRRRPDCKRPPTTRSRRRRLSPPT